MPKHATKVLIGRIMNRCDDTFLWSIIKKQLVNVPSSHMPIYWIFLKEARKVIRQGGNIDKDKYRAWGADPQILDYIEKILKYCTGN